MAKAERRKYGVTQKPLQGTRILIKQMDHDFGTPAVATLIINDQKGTYTSANVYGEGDDQHLGKGYDPERMTHSLPPANGDKWKTWRKSGYVEGNLADFPVFEKITVTQGQEKAKS
jgi:hypothetical protein